MNKFIHFKHLPNSRSPEDYVWMDGQDSEFMQFVFKWIEGNFDPDVFKEELEEYGGALIEWLIENDYDPTNPSLHLMQIFRNDTNDDYEYEEILNNLAWKERLPESLEEGDYRWHSKDHEFQSFIFKWIAEEFPLIYEKNLAVEVVLWLYLNDFYPANPKFNLIHIFIGIFDAENIEDIHDSANITYFCDLLEIMYLGYFYGKSNQPKNLTKAISEYLNLFQES